MPSSCKRPRSETSTFDARLQWDWPASGSWRSSARLGLQRTVVGYWRADEGGGSAIVTQIGFTPTLRYWATGETKGWFGEAGIGFNALTHLSTRENRFPRLSISAITRVATGRHARRWSGLGCSTSPTPACTTQSGGETSARCDWWCR